MSKKKIRVLFVDDEEGNRKAFKATFRRDMDVVLASSGEEALRLLEQEPVHVIVSDQRMPDMVGSELLTLVRDRYPDTMRILLTGYSDLEAVAQAINKGGIFAYATKPWDENDLRMRILQAHELQELRASREALLNQYSQIFGSAGDPIVLVDHRGRIIEANPACGKLLGVDQRELIGRGFMQHVVNARDLMRTLRKHPREGGPINVDLTIRGRDSALIDCMMTLTHLTGCKAGKVVFQAIIKDITDRTQEEKRLRKLNRDLDRRVAVRTAQLLEALEDIGSFSYSVAHDLRSPLKNVLALSEHLHAQATSKGDNDSLPFTERIQKGAQRMLELVDDLLRFSQTNTREIERRTVDLNELVDMVIHEQVPEQRQPHVHVDIAPGTEVLADAPMLKVVLHNLLSNALKFSAQVPEPRILIAHRTTDEHDVIEVRDNGVGFDNKHKEQVFGAFKRLHTNAQYEGTGVGLAIVLRIVRKHGGLVSAESEPGVGTTLRIALPRSVAEQSQPPFFKVA